MTKKLKYYFVLIMVLWPFLSVFSQNIALNHTGNKVDSITKFIKLSEQYRFTNPKQGLIYAKQALKNSVLIQDTTLMIKSANRLAILQKENSAINTALGTIITALSWAKKSGNDSVIANTELVAGHIYSSLNNAEEAIDYYKSCLATFNKKADSSGISYTYSGMGIVYYDNQLYDKALTSYLNAEKYWVDSESALKADLWNNIGALYTDMKDYKTAQYYYNKALMHYHTKEPSSEMSMVYCNLGELARFQHQFGESNNFYLQSLKIGKEIKSPTEIMWAYEGLYQTAKAEQKPNNALKYHERFTTIKDSLDRIQNKKEVLEVETLYHQEENLKKIKEQQLKIAKTERVVEVEKFKNIIFISFSVFILAILILGVILYIKSRNLGKLLLQQKNTIEESLKEKEVLLKEIHHRVKNNLQIISSLLNLQRNSVEDKQSAYIIDETQNRIKAIALVHQKLYQSHNIGKINFSHYLQELVEEQAAVFFDKDKIIKKIIDVPETVNLNIDVAVSLGLITSELITNAFKYAFNSGKENILNISLIEEGKGSYKLIIKDNGEGLPLEFEKGEKESLGMDLVKILADQIKGSLTYQFNDGAEFAVSFSV